MQHSLWADSASEEKRIWTDFVNILSEIDSPVLVHYGSFETNFLKRMCDRYGELPKGSALANAVESSRNLVSVVFAQIYFSTFSNGLKEIAGHLGFTWLDPTVSGAQTIAWRHEDGFVWVFANMEEVAYVYSETRQGSTPQSLLKDFTGVLVSDFYAAYDRIPCPQQKCLIHLIRDLNDAVLKYTYDEELKRLVKGFADLVKPVVETIDQHGLKSHFLRKHLVSVDRFYRRLSGTNLQSKSAETFKECFEKNRDKLFTFLAHDGVPWNNNNAEHTVKAFAMLRRTIAGVTSENDIRDYLVLLSICQTCKYKEVDFLDCLRSGEKDVEAFANSKH